MIREELKSLFKKDTECFAHKVISSSLLRIFDEFILNRIDDTFNSEVLTVYKKFEPMKQQAPSSMKTVLFSTLTDYAKGEVSKEHYLEALVLYRFLFVKSIPDSLDYLAVARILYKLGAEDLCRRFLEIYSETEENKLLSYIELADFYKGINAYKNAIDCYEKFLEVDKTKVAIYTITADLYSKLSGSKSLERQIELYEQAYELQPQNRLVLHGLAFAYEKAGQNDKAKMYYEKLLQNNPTENDYYNYGGFLIHCGDFINGHKYFTHRFNIDDINLKYPSDANKKWDLKSNISDKVLLVNYEQGFGDTIMYSRFVPFLKNIAKEVIFVVQKELESLICGSDIFDNIRIITDINGVDYNVNMALLDVPYVLKIGSDCIPYTSKYLDVSEFDVVKYADRFLNNSYSFKIGLSLNGDRSANYQERDIEVLKIYNLLKDISNVKLYNLQKNSLAVDGVISLGESFDDFKYSACAVKNMDLVVSTDNVILNLAGALGVDTIGLFNKETNYRWFKTRGKNVGWYESVKPLQTNILNEWNGVFSELLKEVKEKSLS